MQHAEAFFQDNLSACVEFRIGDGSARKHEYASLGDALTANPQVSSLRVVFTLNDTSEGRQVAETLKVNTTLTSLVLFNSRISVGLAVAVAESLEVVPGAEFRAGFLAAAALSEGQVLYGQDPETQERKLLGYMNEADAIERTRETLLGADTAQPHEQLVLPRPRDGEEQELSQEQQLWVALYNARAACACPVVLADRHINATVSRVWGSLTPWDRVRLLGSFAWQVTHTHAHATHAHVCTHLTSD